MSASGPLLLSFVRRRLFSLIREGEGFMAPCFTRYPEAASMQAARCEGVFCWRQFGRILKPLIELAASAFCAFSTGTGFFRVAVRDSQLMPTAACTSTTPPSSPPTKKGYFCPAERYFFSNETHNLSGSLPRWARQAAYPSVRATQQKALCAGAQLAG